MSHKNRFQVCIFRNSKCVRYLAERKVFHLTFPYSENAQTALGEHLDNFDKVHQKFRNVMKIQSFAYNFTSNILQTFLSKI